MPVELLTTAECAAFHGVKQKTINAAIKRGAIKTARDHPIYLITDTECRKYRPALTAAEKGARTKGIKKTKKTAATGEGEIV